jgi:hypothetical protein
MNVETSARGRENSPNVQLVYRVAIRDAPIVQLDDRRMSQLENAFGLNRDNVSDLCLAKPSILRVAYEFARDNNESAELGQVAVQYALVTIVKESLSNVDAKGQYRAIADVARPGGSANAAFALIIGYPGTEVVQGSAADVVAACEDKIFEELRISRDKVQSKLATDATPDSLLVQNQEGPRCFAGAGTSMANQVIHHSHNKLAQLGAFFMQEAIEDDIFENAAKRAELARRELSDYNVRQLQRGLEPVVEVVRLLGDFSISEAIGPDAARRQLALNVLKFPLPNSGTFLLSLPSAMLTGTIGKRSEEWLVDPESCVSFMFS